MTNEDLQKLKGLTIHTIELIERKNQDDVLEIHFEDGTELYISGVWQNDLTAGLHIEVRKERE